MLTSSRIKLISLSLLIPVLAVLWSLTNNNNNNDINQDLRLYYEKNRNIIVATSQTTDSPESTEIKKETEIVESTDANKPIQRSVFIRPIELPEPGAVSDIFIGISPPRISIADAEQIRCMAHNIYFEAGGESHWGQVAVARVVMNRVEHGFAANPCQVIYQSNRVTSSDGERQIIRCQFSWVCQGKKTPDTTSEIYHRAKEIATSVIIDNRWADEFNPNVLFFHNHTVNPRWPYKREFVIGNHVFYAKNSTK